MVNQTPDSENPRKLHIGPTGDMLQSQLNTEFFVERFGIQNQFKDDIEDIYLSNIRHFCSEKTIIRSELVTNTTSCKRRIRIGPFSSPMDLVSTREEIQRERGWNLHIQAVGMGLDPDMYIVTGHFQTEAEVKNAVSFLWKIGLSTEIFAVGKEADFAFTSADTTAEIPNMVNSARGGVNHHGRDRIEENVMSSENTTSLYNPKDRWHFESGRLWLQYQDLEIWFEMPSDWRFEDTHSDLFRLAEYVLLSPYEGNILDGWRPSRKPGFRPGLAFSAGVDSTAAMCLMPERTLLFYHERSGFDSQLDHGNAKAFINYLIEEEARPVITTRSNHELIRTIGGKGVGFSTDYACAVHVILLADH